MSKVIIQVLNEKKIYEPLVCDNVQWVTERKSVPGKLTFEVIKDKALKITEGNAVKMLLGKKKVFFGYIFTKSRTKDNKIKITCYDQLRYFKNKDTYQYTNKTAKQVLKMICDDFSVKTGKLDDTKYIIKKKLEKNKTLFDIVQNALDDTMTNTNKIYVLYDKFGRIRLQELSTLKSNYVVCNTTAQDYDYKSSIDSNTYNKIKLTYDNTKTGKRDIYIAKDSKKINKWGVLQYHENLKDGENGKYKASQLLKFYNKKSRSLTVKGAIGDISVRAGVSPIVILSLGDIKVKSHMLCEKVTHTFKDNEHTMDLTLIGGTFT